MALSITVNGGGTFSASMEEGPVSFTATLGAVPGPKGDTGATGPTGVIAATAPILYDSGTQTVSIDTDPEFVTVTTGSTQMSSAGVQFPDGVLQTTAFIGEARKEYIIARNDTGSAIAKGKVVYLSGATGNKPTMALAQANAEATSARTIGILIEETANNADGKVIISGAAENIDTSAFTAGQTLYLSSSVAGGMQTTLPAAPLHGVVIGIVTRANPSVGSIEVTIQNYQELSELSDVNVSDKANNDGLFWEASSSTWRSKTIAEVLGLTPIALSSLSASAPIAYNSGTGAFTFDSSGFLLKADNLSGLASVSTARTNLGLGTMATETASNYAPLASPAFTGNPTAPTPATSDNDTSVATTAFVNAYCPAASTTTAGKVELATDAEAIDGISTSLVLTASSAKKSEISTALWGHFAGAAFTQVVSGGASTFVNEGAIVVAGANAATSYGIRKFAPGVNVLFSRGKNYGIINYSKHIGLAFRAMINGTPTSDTIYRATIGKVTTDNNGDLSRKGIGIKIVGLGPVELQVHDGTTLTNVSSSFTATASEVFDVEIYSNGAGGVSLVINGIEVATTTAGPTGDGTTTSNVLQFEAENINASANNVSILFSGPKMHFAR